MEQQICNDDKATCPACGTRLLGWDCLTNGDIWFCDDSCADIWDQYHEDKE